MRKKGKKREQTVSDRGNTSGNDLLKKGTILCYQEEEMGSIRRGGGGGGRSLRSPV